MDVPYEIKPMGGLHVPAGESRCFAIPFVHRAIINKFIVAQVAGVYGGFTAAFFNAEVACNGGSESDSTGPDTGGLPPDLYRVTPDFTAVNGRVMYFSDDNGGFGYMFFGQERNSVESRLAASKGSRTIYLKITAGAGGGGEFAVSLGALSFAGG